MRKFSGSSEEEEKRKICFPFSAFALALRLLVHGSVAQARWFTFDFQVGRTFGISSGVGHLTRHRHPAVVQDERVFAAVLNDVHVLSDHMTC